MVFGNVRFGKSEEIARGNHLVAVDDVVPPWILPSQYLVCLALNSTIAKTRLQIGTLARVFVPLVNYNGVDFFAHLV